MAFSTFDLSVVHWDDNNTVWKYTTSDSLAAVLAADYFDAALITPLFLPIRAKDSILVVADDGAAGAEWLVVNTSNSTDGIIIGSSSNSFLNITRFGVRMDGETVNTTALQAALDECVDTDGSLVCGLEIPQGICLTDTCKYQSQSFRGAGSWVEQGSSVGLASYFKSRPGRDVFLMVEDGDDPTTYPGVGKDAQMAVWRDFGFIIDNSVATLTGETRHQSVSNAALAIPWSDGTTTDRPGLYNARFYNVSCRASAGSGVAANKKTAFLYAEKSIYQPTMIDVRCNDIGFAICIGEPKTNLASASLASDLGVFINWLIEGCNEGWYHRGGKNGHIFNMKIITNSDGLFGFRLLDLPGDADTSVMSGWNIGGLNVEPVGGDTLLEDWLLIEGESHVVVDSPLCSPTLTEPGRIACNRSTFIGCAIFGKSGDEPNLIIEGDHNTFENASPRTKNTDVVSDLGLGNSFVTTSDSVSDTRPSTLGTFMGKPRKNTVALRGVDPDFLQKHIIGSIQPHLNIADFGIFGPDELYPASGSGITRQDSSDPMALFDRELVLASGTAARKFEIAYGGTTMLWGTHIPIVAGTAFFCVKLADSNVNVTFTVQRVGIADIVTSTQAATTSYTILAVDVPDVSSVVAGNGFSLTYVVAGTAQDMSIAWAGWVPWFQRIAVSASILMPNIPTSDPADGTNTLWSNSGVITLGT